MITRAFAVWTGLLLCAMLNGFAREAWLAPRLGARTAHIVSTLMLSFAIAVLTWLTIPWLAPPSPRAAAAIGLLWAISTVVFELGFGRLVAHKSWATLLNDYNVARGRVWPLVLVTTAIAPWLMGHARRLF